MGRSELGADHSKGEPTMEAKAETKINGGRIRKVTITEVEDEAKIENKPKEKSTEEIFNEVGKMISDWKTNLEVVVGEGLKKIKKICKEKKLMVKYLPGDGNELGVTKIQGAKDSIVEECFFDVLSTVGKTHGSLNELGNRKASEAEKTMNLFKGKNSEENKEAAKPQKDAANFFEMKRMMKELETLYSQYNEANFAYNKVPIYSINSNFTSQNILKGRNTFFPWWKPMCTLNQLIDLQRLCKSIS